MIENIRALAIFAETLRQGSFRGAAARLKMSPSAVSYNISELEKRLGTALLYRSTRKLTATDAGKRLFAHAEPMLAHAQSGLQDITHNKGEMRGRLHITLPSGLIQSNFNRGVAVFCQQHPHIKMQITYTDTRQDLIAQGIDLAIRAGVMPDSALKSTRLGNVNRMLVCSPEMAENHPAPDTPQDLAGWDWVMMEMMPKEKHFTHPHKEMQAVLMQGAVTVNSIEAATQMCTQGLGLATPPDYLAHQAVAAGHLKELLPEWAVAPIPVYAVRPNNGVPNSMVSALIAHLKRT